jgi:type I restriction enzyme S subunit
MKAKGQVPRDDKWKAKYEEPKQPEASELPALPEGWCWASVEQLASPIPRSLQSGPFGSSLLHSEFQETGVLAIGIDNVEDGRFSMGRQHRISPIKYAELSKYTARAFDVLITVMATVGRTCVVPAEIETAIITKHVYRITVDRGLADPFFVMQSLRGSASVRQQLYGSVQGQTRPGINGEILRRIALALPPLAEQHRIIAEIDRLLSIADELGPEVRAQLARTVRLRQSVLKHAFEGRLVPQDPMDEPASALLDRVRNEQAAKADRATNTTSGPRRRRAVHAAVIERGGNG